MISLSKSIRALVGNWRALSVILRILQCKVLLISLNVVGRTFRRFAYDVTAVVSVLVHGVHARREFIARLECPSSERLFLRLGARYESAQRVEELFSHRARVE